MTKRDYELIARIIREQIFDSRCQYAVAEVFAAEFALRNPRFDMVAFLAAAHGKLRR